MAHWNTPPRRRVRGIVRLAVVLAIAAAGLGVSTIAQAEPLIASDVTPGCASAPLWRIRFELYWTDAQGHQTDQSILPALLSQTSLFARAVGIDSACGIRVQVDVFDEGSTPWPTNPNASYVAPPADIGATLAAGYDSEFVRYPARGDESYTAVTEATPDFGAGSYSDFPVRPNGAQVPGTVPELDPWEMQLMHEWLAQIVGYYDPALGWPASGADGACGHGYVDALRRACDNVDEHYFSDMLQGKVAEAGGLRGITAADFTKDDTPAHPVRVIALDSPTLTPVGRAVRLGFEPASYDGTIAVTALDASGAMVGQGVASGTSPHFDWTLPARPGSYQLCWALAGSARDRPQRDCQPVVVRRTIDVVSIPVAHVARTHTPGTFRVHVTYARTLESVLDDSAEAAPSLTSAVVTLMLRVGGHVISTRHVRLLHASQTVAFSARLPRDARSLIVQLRPRTQDDSVIAWSAPRSAAIPRSTPPTRP
jgi:hypothetical protein